jgi:hypothetical protein
VWLWAERGSILAVWNPPAAAVLWWTYGVTFGAYLTLLASDNAKSLGITSELLRLFSIGALAMLLGGNTKFALGARSCWLPLVALSPIYLLALSSGMKSEVFLVSLPILLPIFRRITVTGLALLFGFILFVVLFVFPFSQAWREINWFSKQDSSISAVAAYVFDQWSREGFLNTAAASTSHWLTRGSTSQIGGLVMQLAEQDGLLGPVLLAGLATIFIPRFLWPDKPLYMPGAWFTWYLGQAQSPEEATSSTAMMLPTELYWMFGAAGVVVGMIFFALLYSACWRMLWKLSASGAIPAVAMFAMLARSSNLEEVHTIYAFASPIMLIVYVIVFDRVQKLLWPGWTGAVGTERGRK